MGFSYDHSWNNNVESKTTWVSNDIQIPAVKSYSLRIRTYNTIIMFNEGREVRRSKIKTRIFEREIRKTWLYQKNEEKRDCVKKMESSQEATIMYIELRG